MDQHAFMQEDFGLPLHSAEQTMSSRGQNFHAVYGPDATPEKIFNNVLL
jgi:hypothetical protein